LEGDCRQIFPTLPEASFDCLIADPPYNVTDEVWDQFATPDDFLSFTRGWLSLALPLLRSEHHAFVFCSPAYMADIERMMRDDLDLTITDRIVWQHKGLPLGRRVSNRLIGAWDAILHVGTTALHLPDEWGPERFNVQTFAVPQSNYKDVRLHPTQKPLELIKWLVEIGTGPAGNVLDPFGGAGTTAAACVETGRSCTTVEQDAEFCRVIQGRLSA
jgi:DNA modification methylase